MRTPTLFVGKNLRPHQLFIRRDSHLALRLTGKKNNKSLDLILAGLFVLMRRESAPHWQARPRAFFSRKIRPSMAVVTAAIGPVFARPTCA
jgi:hypothetical protein